MTTKATTKVFTEVWTQESRKRNESRPKSQWPWPYYIATDSGFLLLREKVEDLVAALPDCSQPTVIERLRSAKQFCQTYHELVIREYLTNLGLQTEYEKELNGQTPDWYASASDASEAFIVEVVTENISASRDAENKQIADLTHRLSQIRRDVVLRISVTHEFANVKLNSRRTKDLAHGVEKSLERDTFQVGTQFPYYDFTFEVMQRDRGFTHLQCVGICREARADLKSLNRNIHDKVSKYKAIAASKNIPLLVAVVPARQTNYGVHEMKLTLFGSAFGGNVLTDGIFAKEPFLSGAMLALPLGLVEWRMHYYSNPRAHNSLPETIFRDK